MNIKYFQETDTLYIEFRKGEISETCDLDENTLLDVDSFGADRGNDHRAGSRPRRHPAVFV